MPYYYIGIKRVIQTSHKRTLNLSSNATEPQFQQTSNHATCVASARPSCTAASARVLMCSLPQPEPSTIHGDLSPPHLQLQYSYCTYITITLLAVTSQSATTPVTSITPTTALMLHYCDLNHTHHSTHAALQYSYCTLTSVLTSQSHTTILKQEY